MSERWDDGSRSDRLLAQLRRDFDPEEFRRRNASALAMDVLYLLTSAFLASLTVRGFWPALIGALPLAAFLYFAWKSSSAFFTAQLIVVLVTAYATVAGLVPF